MSSTIQPISVPISEDYPTIPPKEAVEAFNQMFDCLRRERMKKPGLVGQIEIYKWVWPELKLAVEEGLVGLIYRPWALVDGDTGKPLIGVTGKDAKATYLEEIEGEKTGREPRHFLFRGDMIENRVRYSVPDNKLEGFYELLERNATYEEVISFLGDENMFTGEGGPKPSYNPPRKEHLISGLMKKLFS